MDELYKTIPGLVDWDYERDGILLHKYYFTTDSNADKYYNSDIDIIDINNWSISQISKYINDIVDSAKKTYIKAKYIKPYYSGSKDPLSGFFLFLTAIV